MIKNCFCFDEIRYIVVETFYFLIICERKKKRKKKEKRKKKPVKIEKNKMG